MNFTTEFVQWGIATASMFNTIVLLWLGLTVWLQARRGAWVAWVAGLGMMLGGLFFVGHTATLDYHLEDLLAQMGRWWIPAWCSVILLPLGWYGLMLWYAGFWDDNHLPRAQRSQLYRRQKRWLAFTIFIAILLIIVLFVVNPFRLLQLMADFDGRFRVRALPWLFALYPPYLLACGVLSIDALRRPGPTARLMGDQARRRARPWLIGSSVLQFCVSLLVALVLERVVALVLREQPARVVSEVITFVDSVDLLATVLISGAIVLMGKAIVSHEIFSAQALPRRGFFKQWRQFVLLAAAYSALVALAWALPLRPVYPLLLTTILLSVSYALFAWRSFADREAHIAGLRPFLRSQHFFDSLLGGQSALQVLADDENQTSTPQQGASEQFRALCAEVLNVRVAYLIPLGSVSPLFGPPLCFPTTKSAPSLANLVEKLQDVRLCCGVESENFGGAQWAVPLWSTRGLSGVLLLGARADNALFAQEEIEIAQSGGERLIDTRAGGEIAARLMDLQRRKLTQSRLVDHRTRRTLHDDILPQLHAAMLSLSALPNLNGAGTETLNQLADVHRQISNLLREMPLSTTPEWERKGLAGALRDCLNYEFAGHFDNTEFTIDAETELQAAQLPALTGEVLFHAAREAIRNAARYARAPGRELQLKVTLQRSDNWTICIEDNGIGVPPENENLPRDGAGGSGQGLSLHGTMLAIVGGTLAIASAPQQGTRVTIVLPLSDAAVAV